MRASDLAQSDGGGAAHVSFHVGQAGAARAIGDVAAAGACRQVAYLDGAEFGELLGAIPDVAKALLAHVAAGHGKLHAGKYVAGRGDVGQRVAGAATVALEHVVVDCRNRGAKLADIPHELFGVEDFFKLFFGDAEAEDGAVAVEHGRDGGIDVELDAEISGERLDGLPLAGVLLHQHVGDGDFDAFRLEELDGLERAAQRSGQLGDGVVNLGAVGVDADLHLLDAELS